MKVLLCEDVNKLGWLGDIVEVAEGYARNYLLPQGLATVATEGNIRSLAKEKGKRAIQRVAEGKRLEKAAEAVKEAEAVLAAKANEQGHLFGSVTEKHIAANLREQGFEVPDSVVKLSEHIKQIGTHEVILRYSDEIKVPVSVVVVAESEDTLAETKEGEAKEDEAKA